MGHFSFLAVYSPIGGGDFITRHVANGTCDRALVETDGLAMRRARDLPEGAEYMSFSLILHTGADGYDATMAKVNTGVPGVPA